VTRHERVLQVIEERLEGRAGRMLIERLRTAVSETPDSTEGWTRTIKNVRTAARLFIDVATAEKLTIELSAAAGISAPLAR
jgi:hypothetical protein